MATAPWQSKLIPYEKEISMMWYNERATLKEIQTFLINQEITVSLPTISRFIKCRKQHPDPHIGSLPSASQAIARKTALSKLNELMKHTKSH